MLMIRCVHVQVCVGDESNRLGYDIRSKLNLEIADLGKEGSRFFKEVYINPSRMGAQIREDQVEDTLE